MKKYAGTVIVVAILAALLVGYYFYLSNRNPGGEEKTTDEEISEVSRILNKDFDAEYPKTPRSVVKWYNRIITEYYAEKHSDAEIEGLADQARKLLDADLLEQNPRDTFIESVKADIADYANREASIVTSDVASSNNVQYATVDGRECAYVDAYYSVKEKNAYTRTYQEFCLRKDDDGNWKILTWRLTTGDPSDFE